VASKVNSITETVTAYTGSVIVNEVDLNSIEITLFPNPSQDYVAVQVGDLVTENVQVELFDAAGKLVRTSMILQGSTLTYLDVRTLYNGTYIAKFTAGNRVESKVVTVARA